MELVLLDELVQVGRQQLKDKAQVVFVDERVSESQNVVLVVWITLLVELGGRAENKRMNTPTARIATH